jgi:hypothetical protein
MLDHVIVTVSDFTRSPHSVIGLASTYVFPISFLSATYRTRSTWRFNLNRLHPVLRAIQASALRRWSVSADED